MSVYHLDRFYKSPCVVITVECAFEAAKSVAPGCRPVRVCVWPEDVPEVVEIFCEGAPSVKLMREPSQKLLAEYYAGEKYCYEVEIGGRG